MICTAKIRNILFDFDGTLMDSSEGVAAAFSALGKHYGISIPPETCRKMIGPPLLYSLVHILGFAPEQAEEAMEVYRRAYAGEGMFLASVYPGIPGLLQRLHQAGRKLFVATSKPEVYARQILEKKGLARWFTFTGGSDLAETERAEKADVIRYVLETCGLDPAECLMAGDRKYDVLGAAANGVQTAGVLYGFGSREELESAGAAFLCATPGELGDRILADAGCNPDGGAPA